MLRVSFSPAPECVVADCWNRAFPTPPCHQTPVVVIVIVIIRLLFYTRLNKRLSRECVYWKAIITTQRYLGPSTCYKNVIHDIGTKILFLQSNDHNSTHIAPLELAFSIDYTKFCVLCCGTVKTWFKAFWDIFLKFCMRPWIRSLCFQSAFLPEGPTKSPKLIFHF